MQSERNKDLQLYQIIKEIQTKCKYRYGYRRVQIALRKKYGLTINRKRILRIMSKYGLLSKIRRKHIYIKGHQPQHTYKNLLRQNFETDKINHKWTTDISYIITPEGRLYLSVVRDVCDGFVIAYKYSTRQEVKLVADTIKAALKQYNLRDTILHSDQGFQYTSHLYHKLTTENGLIPSMSRRGTPLDNAPMESFFSAFKSECIYLENPKTIQEAKYLCDEYIDFYNFERIQLRHQAAPSEVRQQKISLAG